MIQQYKNRRNKKSLIIRKDVWEIFYCKVEQGAGV